VGKKVGDYLLTYFLHEAESFWRIQPVFS